MNRPVIIVGAGLVGSLLAILLGKKGYKVKLFERRPDTRKTKQYAGKSINLALSDRGIKGLQLAGVLDDIMKISIPVYGRTIHNTDSSVYFQPYSADGKCNYSVSRAEINYTLMNIAESLPNVSIHFNERCTDVDFQNTTVTFENIETKKTSTEQAEIIFGADGAFSAVRLNMMLKNDRYQYQQFYIETGYKELIIPPDKNGNFMLTNHESLHIWPRKEFMLMALPNPTGDFTCTLFMPLEGKHSFEQLKTKEQVEEFFKIYFPDAVPVMPTFLHDFFHNPTSSLVTVRAYPWVINKVALIGDAAHAITPFYGQGMNAGFEDCIILMQLLEKHQHNWSIILNEYQQIRKKDGDAIAQLALDNHIEMRDKTANPRFILQKKIEQWFYKKHPDKWIPLYDMVTYRPDIRYSEALQKGYYQDKIMQEVLNQPDIEQNWETEKTEQLILHLLEKNPFRYQ
ncbi:MAG: FAD-dependent monooxygenase [Bacteroidia bacterium]|nr:FAD-dependent monooxygenase [Bacteroidia bacterium]